VVSRRRRPPSIREALERDLARYADDPERLEIVVRHGQHHGLIDEQGNLIEPPKPRSMNDRIRDAARPSARIERLTRRARGEPES
jgi:hypothetical protein